MAGGYDIKTDISVKSDTSNLAKAAGSNFSNDGLTCNSTLPTCVGFKDRGTQIVRVLQDFNKLITRDVSQIDKFIDNMLNQDNS